MIYERLEQAPAWVESIELAALVYNLTSVASEAFEAKDSLRTQFELAGLSVSNAIAAGFERTPNDLTACLLKAYGATNEVRSMLNLIEMFPSFGASATLVADLKAKCDRCSAELKTWIRSLHQSSTNGHALVDPAREEERRRIAREKRAVFEGLRQLNGA